MAMSRKAATVSSFFAMSLRRLHPHHPNHRLTAFSPSAALSCNAYEPGHLFNFEDYPYPSSILSGPTVMMVPKLVDDSFFCFRVEVPGLSSKDLNMWVDADKNMRLEGTWKSEPKYAYKGGFYQATIAGCPNLCDMDNIKAELKDGVLWITEPLNEGAKDLRKFQRKMENGMV